MPPIVPETNTVNADTSHVVFVPVPGALVFGTCVLLIVFCVIWMCLLWRKGLEEDKR